MDYLSTRGASAPVNLDAALNAGLAPDGGLYVPRTLPRLELAAFDGAATLPEVAARLLAPFFAGSKLAPQLDAICAAALALPLELRQLAPRLAVFELFHGPTAAFKDFAARFLAECMARLRQPEDPDSTVLVATSGDTGAAVAAAFHRRPGFRVVILYPHGRVAPRQAHHLGAFGDNVAAFAVDGSFDDCQALAKTAFGDAALRAVRPLASANSISLGRLLPQAAYYAWLALELQRAGSAPPQLVIPSGNLGNGLAAILARTLGLPLGGIVLATNANPTLAEFFGGADYRGRPSIATLANAMDVGAPSNAERLRHWFDDATLRREFRALQVDDAAIRAEIVAIEREHGYVACPHTACGFAVARQVAQPDVPQVIVATAHPAKFPEVVEPLLGRSIEPPPALAQWLARPSTAAPLANDYAALRALLLG